MNLPVPVIPDESNEHVLSGEFWDDLAKELRSRAEGNLREYIFDLWANQCDADTIMKMFGITEEELDAIIPRSKWLVSKWIKCTRCDGKGGRSIKVPWNERT